MDNIISVDIGHKGLMPGVKRASEPARVSDMLIKVGSRQHGVRRVVLDVTDENARATALYERYEFVPSGVVGCLDPPQEHVTEHQRERWMWMWMVNSHVRAWLACFSRLSNGAISSPVLANVYIIMPCFAIPTY